MLLVISNYKITFVYVFIIVSRNHTARNKSIEEVQDFTQKIYIITLLLFYFIGIILHHYVINSTKS